ncbi:MAG: polysaccharide export protein, partial [Planctomycetes bacterium]|nr:polysaccharide export protein [Planctomycetota bacterium]MCB9871784.1 polysaccharide export protein [Planctomycetota bacterium]
MQPQHRRGRLRAGFAPAVCLAFLGCSQVATINQRARLVESARAADTAPRLPEAALLPPRPAHEYRLGPMDLVEVEVFELEEPNRTKRIRTRVAQDGAVRIPLLGSVPAGGQTCAELQQELERRLAADFLRDPSVHVTVAEFKARRITVLGAVRTPGSFDLDRQATTLLHALARAGGPTDKAGASVFVLRATAPAAQTPTDPPARPLADSATAASEGRLIQVDLRKLVERGDLRLDRTLHDGDIVHVPTAPLCFVTGMVHHPGSFPIRGDMTILRSIALAGGMRDQASPALTVLIRTTEQGRTTIPIDLANIGAGSSNDLKMRPGDVLVLSESSGSKVRRGLFEFFRGIFTVGYALR